MIVHNLFLNAITMTNSVSDVNGSVSESTGRMIQSDSSRRKSGDVTMTKRSGTPLASVSDRESDSENSPTPREDLSGRNHNDDQVLGVNESGEVILTPRDSRKRESPRGGVDGDNLNSTWELLYRPKVSRHSPRTTVSLDTVDLWDNSDTDTETDEFDQIEGVCINPSQTIDLSSIGRPSVNVTTFTGARCTPNATLPLVIDTSSNKTFKQKDRISPRDLTVNSRARAARRMRTMFPAQDKLADNKYPQIHQPKPHLINGGRSYDVNCMATLRTKDEKHAVRPTTPTPPVQCKADIRIVRRSVENSTSVTPVKTKPSPYIPPKYASRKQKDTLQLGSKAVNSGEADDGTKSITSKFTTGLNCKSNTKNRTHDDVMSTRFIPRGDDKAVHPANNSTQTASSRTPPRKVKFSSMVTVREGEENSMGALRNSNNSAQLYKQRYMSSANGHNMCDMTATEEQSAPWNTSLNLVC